MYPSPENSTTGIAITKGRTKKGAITPKLGEDYLQTEIQIQRSDNSILRQDIQVFRTREQQLYSRNQDLQDKLVEALSPRHSAKTEKVQEQVQSEAVINVDFVGENEFDGPKAVFEAKTKPAKGKESLQPNHPEEVPAKTEGLPEILVKKENLDH